VSVRGLIFIIKGVKLNVSFSYEVLTKFGSLKKKYEKSHFMLILGELLVCSLQKQGRFSLFVPWKKGD